MHFHPGSLRRPVIAAGAALLAWHLPASAIPEVEPNDTRATAQVITATGGFSIEGQRTFADPSDDFFAFQVTAPGALSITASSPSTSADSIMGLYNPAGVLVASNDDGPGIGAMSLISFDVKADQLGAFTIGFSGFNPGLISCAGSVTQCYDTNNDFAFDTFVAGGGAGGSTGWSYRLSVVAPVPEPASFAMLAAGLVLLVLGRRRSRRAPPGA